MTQNSNRHNTNYTGKTSGNNFTSNNAENNMKSNGARNNDNSSAKGNQFVDGYISGDSARSSSSHKFKDQE